MISKNEFLAYFSRVPEDQRQIVENTIDDYLFFASQIEDLKKMPLIRVEKRDPARQQVTAAGKLIKDYSNILDSKSKILLKILEKNGKSEAEELMDRLKDFE